MLGMKKFALTLLLLSAVAAAQTTTPAPAPTATPTAAAAPAVQDPNALVAQIGSEKVTLAEFDNAFRLAVARVVNQQGMPFDAKVMEQFAEARPDFLKQFVRDRAVYQLARASVKADTAAIDEQVAKAKEGFKSDEELAQALAGSGFKDIEEFRAGLERQNVVNTYLENLQKKFTFSDSMVNTFYNLNKSSFKTDAEACVKHILVATKEEADAIAKELAAGGDFAKIAEAKSKDPGSAKQGGDLGCLAQGETVPTFDKASFSGPLNKLQVVQSEFGWHLLTVTKRTEAGVRELAEMAPLIRSQMQRDAAQKYLDSQVARLNIKSLPEVVTVAPKK